MSDIKPKVPICPRCGYGMGIRRKQKFCKACLEAEGSSSAEKSLKTIKKKLVLQKASARPKASPSGARTRNRTPKATRP
jgi:hypothetical protein